VQIVLHAMKKMTSPWTKSLGQLLGAANVITDAATIEANHAQGVKPACLCAPANASEIAAVLRFAADNKIPVLPRGGGTAQGIGGPPQAGALVLSTKRLNRLIHHEPGDMVATVEAGMTLGEFQTALALNGQWLPLDGDPHATLGGLIATDRSGPRALGYGTLRDLVLGMTVVNGDGVARKCGGKVVKNVTGYDLAKLYIGSLGTLGVVTEVTFKLRPLAIDRRAWSIQGIDISGGVACLAKIAALNLPLEQLDAYIVPKEAKANIGAMAAGTPAELDRIARELSTIAQTYSKAPVPSDVGKSWNDGMQLLNTVPSFASGFQIRAWFPRSRSADAVKILSDYAVGIWLNSDNALATFARSPETAATLAAILAKSGFNYRFENAQGLHISEPFGPARPEWPLMKQIRSALDPHGILNPGRFVV